MVFIRQFGQANRQKMIEILSIDILLSFWLMLLNFVDIAVSST